MATALTRFRFYKGSTPQYVTVDQQLPTNSNGDLMFDGYGADSATDASNVLWPALAEKAYVQINESGWVRPVSQEAARMSIPLFLKVIHTLCWDSLRVRPRLAFESVSAPTSFATLAAAFTRGDSVCLASSGSPPSNQVIESHEYAVLSVDTVAQTVTLFNPWGLNNSHDSGTITLSWSSSRQISITSSKIPCKTDLNFYVIRIALRCKSIQDGGFLRISQLQSRVCPSSSAPSFLCASAP